MTIVTKAADLAALATRVRELHQADPELSVHDAFLRAVDEDADARAAFLSGELNARAVVQRVQMLEQAQPEEENTMSTKRYKDVIFETRIQPLAAEIRKRNPSLTEAQSVVKALETPEGKAAYAESTAPDAHLPLAEVVEKRRREERMGKLFAPLGGTTAGQVVAKLAKAHSPSDPATGMRWVRKSSPALYALYEAEKNRVLG